MLIFVGDGLFLTKAKGVLLICLLSLFLGCSKSEDLKLSSSNQNDLPPIDTVLNGGGKTINPCSPIVAEGKFYKLNGKTYLWGGADQSTHFDISNWNLSECNLFYGLGREHFVVPRTSEFDKIEDVIDNFDNIEKVILLKSSGVTKIYPFKILVKPEMVNDVVDNEPIMVVYCFLADLVAIYDRSYNGRALTFAVSGYTYADRNISSGIESFILWDRETESLWWPIIDKGVSGNFLSTKMSKYNDNAWEVTRWGEVKDKYPEALVLRDVWGGHSSGINYDDI